MCTDEAKELGSKPETAVVVIPAEASHMAASRVLTIPAIRYTIAEETIKKITDTTLIEKISEAFVTFGIFDQRIKKKLRLPALIPARRNVRKTRVLEESGY
tara:strand:+ start:3643 stop:3945 length:303 start_codon:yes stop_codon:yes gene_type:complete